MGLKGIVAIARKNNLVTQRLKGRLGRSDLIEYLSRIQARVNSGERVAITPHPKGVLHSQDLITFAQRQGWGYSRVGNTVTMVKV